MPLSAKAIKSKINSVGNIKQITRAMELMSVSKMKQATERVLRSREYAQRAQGILRHVARDQNTIHQLLEYGDGDKSLVVVIGSSKGLCGSFNVNVAKRMRAYTKEVTGQDASEVAFVAVGKRPSKEVGKLENDFPVDLLGSFNEFTENVRERDIRGLARLVLDEFRSGEYRNVVVIYTHYITALKNQVLACQLLPVDPEATLDTLDGVTEVDAEESANLAGYTFEPDEDAVLDAILPRLTEVRLYQMILESQASEHSARMFAMKNATENAEEMKEELQLSYNRARQAQVTREISEISAAANALST